MVHPFSPWSERFDHLPRRLAGLYALLAAMTVLAWGAALWTFRDHPVLLGSCLLAYTLGLRHAIDADHIAAIDNVTRKLMAGGRRPVTVGLYFSLGHSTVVVLASAALAAAATTLGRFDHAKQIGALVGSVVSSGFLLLIAFANALVLLGLWRRLRRCRGGGPSNEPDLDRSPATGGVFGRLLRPLLDLIRQSWHMFPLGILFGLGFDTATEIGVLGLSASAASRGLSIWSIMVFPALFTAGMTVVDTTGGVMMLGVYGRAFDTPTRTLHYNMAVTAASVVIALAIGSVEALGAIGDRLGLEGGLWRGIGVLNEHLGAVGLVVTLVFALVWIAAAVARLREGGRLEAAGSERSRS